MRVGRGGALKDSLIIDEHGLFLLDFGDELEGSGLIPEFFTILTGLLFGLVLLR